VSTPLTRFLKSIKYNPLTKSWYSMRQGPNKECPTTLQIDLSNKYYFYNIFLCAGTGIFAFWLQMKQTMTRGKTFKRNFAIIEEKYGEIHKNEMGADAKLSKFGYPDMGNNLYSDLLPYKDWVMLNNA